MQEKTVFHGMVEEEYDRTLRMIGVYEEKKAALPKGSVQEKTRGKQVYYYLVYRDGNKVINDYIGKDINKVDELREKILDRKELEKTLNRLYTEKREMEYMLNYKEWKNDR